MRAISDTIPAPPVTLPTGRGSLRFHCRNCSLVGVSWASAAEPHLGTTVVIDRSHHSPDRDPGGASRSPRGCLSTAMAGEDGSSSPQPLRAQLLPALPLRPSAAGQREHPSFLVGPTRVPSAPPPPEAPVSRAGAELYSTLFG